MRAEFSLSRDGSCFETKKTALTGTRDRQPSRQTDSARDQIFPAFSFLVLHGRFHPGMTSPSRSKAMKITTRKLPDTEMSSSRDENSNPNRP